MCNNAGMETTTATRIWGDEELYASEIRRRRNQETAVTDRFIRVTIALCTFGLTEVVLAIYNLIGTTR